MYLHCYRKNVYILIRELVSLFGICACACACVSLSLSFMLIFKSYKMFIFNDFEYVVGINSFICDWAWRVIYALPFPVCHVYYIDSKIQTLYLYIHTYIFILYIHLLTFVFNLCGWFFSLYCSCPWALDLCHRICHWNFWQRLACFIHIYRI